MNTMGLGEPWANSLEIIVLQRVRILLGINPMGIIDHLDDYPDIIELNPEKYFLGINPMALSAPRADSL